ncbi:cation transporting ATPase C-terminal domain-containing protein [Streptomyces sp. NBC_01803]|uniref:cation transporting ATPase C-terminal domain-containing protein n=1 Tax=Streptomyces sp. NBC_01803 TaxID=2975946 RepID=UPI002DD950AE|nr:cation transporting ATPase C-terminal domain-containing protein [Streptomyces sp. NBC_01803]
MGSRARPRSLANPLLLVAVAVALALQFAGIFLSPLRALLDTEPLPPAAFLLAAGLACAGYGAMRLAAGRGR